MLLSKRGRENSQIRTVETAATGDLMKAYINTPQKTIWNTCKCNLKV